MAKPPKDTPHSDLDGVDEDAASTPTRRSNPAHSRDKGGADRAD